MSRKTDPRIDAYIARADLFARPILRRLRELVHAGCPGVTETMKWRMPYFEHAGALLCGMAAFKAHCAFGFWHQGMEKVLGRHGAKRDAAMGSLGRITSLADLPGDRTMIGFVRAAVERGESGAPARSRPAGPRKEPPVPAELAAALKKSRAAAKAFAGFSPSHRREYIEWIGEAKREETRHRRVETAIAWLTEGKSRNWKYEAC